VLTPQALKLADVLLDLEMKLPSPLLEGLCLWRRHGDSLTLTEEGLFDDWRKKKMKSNGSAARAQPSLPMTA